MSLGDELLKRNPVTDDEQAAILERITQGQKRVGRLKSLAIGSWILFVGGWVFWAAACGVFIEGAFGEGPPNPDRLIWGASVSIIGLVVLVTAVVSTVSLYVRWRSVTMRQIIVSLVALQEEVRRLSEVTR